MKSAELRAMSTEQLDLTLKDTIKNLFHLRFQSAAERLETPSEMRKARKDIARIKTILRERQITRNMLSLFDSFEGASTLAEMRQAFAKIDKGRISPCERDIVKELEGQLLREKAPDEVRKKLRNSLTSFARHTRGQQEELTQKLGGGA